MRISKNMCIFLSRRKFLQLENFVWQKFYQETTVYENITSNKIDNLGEIWGSSYLEVLKEKKYGF